MKAETKKMPLLAYTMYTTSDIALRKKKKKKKKKNACKIEVSGRQKQKVTLHASQLRSLLLLSVALRPQKPQAY